MFKPLSLYIGLRYIRAKRRNQFISFVSSISMIGIALGVAVLVTVLSVMNGFDQQIRERIFVMAPHMTITESSDTLSNWEHLKNRLKHQSQIIAMAPYVNGQGLLVSNNELYPVFVKGIIPEHEKNISVLSTKLVSGVLTDLKENQFGIILGQNLAWHVGVRVGDKINLVTPQTLLTPMGLVPRLKQFTVIGIFHIGAGFGFDDSYAVIHLNDAQKLYNLHQKVSGIQLKLKNLFDAPALSLDLLKNIDPSYQISDWTEKYGGFYHAVEMEKTIMFFILLLLVAIAAFNLVSSLVMLVNEKQADIAILRTLGATPSLIMKIFMVQGTMVGVMGTFIGIMGGIVLSLNVTRLTNFIQNTFHIQLLAQNVYFVDYLPSQLQMMDVGKIAFTSLLMSLLATLYPAWRAARTHPVEALRYE
jgi:lipoprotein-releasing system permease protein